MGLRMHWTALQCIADTIKSKNESTLIVISPVAEWRDGLKWAHADFGTICPTLALGLCTCSHRGMWKLDMEQCLT